jgi:hypothetical protein
VLLFDDPLAANPMTIGRAVYRTGLRFLRPLSYMGGAAVLVAGYLLLVLHIASPILALGAWLSFWWLACYSALTAMHLLGLEYHRNARKLDWFREDRRSRS